MKRQLLLFCAVLTLFACDKDDNEPSGSNSGNSSGSGGYSYVSGPEGGDFTITHSDGSTENVAATAVIGWDGGMLLEGNYWRQLRLSTSVGTFFLRYNLPADYEWETEIQGTHSLYNFPYLLEYSTDMDGMYVEVYCPTCDDFEGNASGFATVVIDAPTPSGTYDVVGEIEADFTEFGQTTTIEGVFWAEELN